MRLHTIFGADVTVFHYPKHAVAVRGPRKRSKPTVGFKSLPTWTPTQHNVNFARAAYENYGKPYKEFIASMAMHPFPKTGQDPSRLRELKHQAAGRRIESMAEQVSRSGRGGFAVRGAGRGYGMGPEAVPEWY